MHADADAVYTLDNTGRKLLRIALADGAVTSVPWPGDQMQMQVPGTLGRCILMLKREGESEGNAPGAPIALCAVNVDDGSVQALHTFAQGVYGAFGTPQKDGKLYYVNLTTRAVMAYDLATDTETLVTDAFAQYGVPFAADYEAQGMTPEDAARKRESAPLDYPAAGWYGTLVGDWLLAQVGDYGAKSSLHAYNLQTGEQKEITFTDFRNGSGHNIAVHALTPLGALVTEETRMYTVSGVGKSGTPFEQENSYDVFALIALDDLLNNVPNFRTIAPVHYGA